MRCHIQSCHMTTLVELMKKRCLKWSLAFDLISQLPIMSANGHRSARLVGFVAWPSSQWPSSSIYLARLKFSNEKINYCKCDLVFSSSFNSAWRGDLTLNAFSSHLKTQWRITLPLLKVLQWAWKIICLWSKIGCNCNELFRYHRHVTNWPINSLKNFQVTQIIVKELWWSLSKFKELNPHWIHP